MQTNKHGTNYCYWRKWIILIIGGCNWNVGGVSNIESLSLHDDGINCDICDLNDIISAHSSFFYPIPKVIVICFGYGGRSKCIFQIKGNKEICL